MTFYLLGPSGAGKTTLGKLLAEKGVIKFLDSDDVLGDRYDQWEAVEKELELWDSHTEALPLVVAVGAGTQNLDGHTPGQPLKQWLADDRREGVIAILCDPEETLKRRSGHHPSLQSVHGMEFAEARVELYELASESIKTTGRNKPESADELLTALGTIDSRWKPHFHRHLSASDQSIEQ
ncbi:shikimate kinase [Paenarthrobacter sp. C1]|uniref:shikimate kinase n=1 Tax=Paenarthrobacter sp. C1 TaxID=3400220 RepID=UPI003BF556D7